MVRIAYRLTLLGLGPRPRYPPRQAYGEHGTTITTTVTITSYVAVTPKSCLVPATTGVSGTVTAITAPTEADSPSGAAGPSSALSSEEIDSSSPELTAEDSGSPVADTSVVSGRPTETPLSGDSGSATDVPSLSVSTRIDGCENGGPSPTFSSGGIVSSSPEQATEIAAELWPTGYGVPTISGIPSGHPTGAVSRSGSGGAGPTESIEGTTTITLTTLGTTFITITKPGPTITVSEDPVPRTESEGGLWSETKTCLETATIGSDLPGQDTASPLVESRGTSVGSGSPELSTPSPEGSTSVGTSSGSYPG